MKTISVGFSFHNGSIFSNAIMWGLRIPFSHVYVKVKNEFTNNLMINQASGLQVNCTNNEIFLKHNTVIKEIHFEITDDQYRTVVEFFESRFGLPYSLKQIIGFCYIIILSKLGIRVKNPFQNGEGQYVCSEIVVELLHALFKLKIPKDYDSISPLDVAELFVKNKLCERFW